MQVKGPTTETKLLFNSQFSAGNDKKLTTVAIHVEILIPLRLLCFHRQKIISCVISKGKHCSLRESLSLLGTSYFLYVYLSLEAKHFHISAISFRGVHLKKYLKCAMLSF